MQKITPHLWFNKEAKESAEFYVSIFPDSKIKNHSVIKGTPSGDCDVMSYELAGQSFMSISAGPYFKINPSISFMVNFDPSRDDNAKENLTTLWAKLSEGGKVMMPLQEYPFSKWYGWIEDKYGVSWQLILTNPAGEQRPFIIPCLLFVGDAYGKAEEAVDYYVSVFKDARLGQRMKYPAGAEPNKEGMVMFSDFNLLGTWFAAMDGGGEHRFAFNEAISFIVNCDRQEEIDYFWEKLSHVKEAEQCGWLKDKFGISWQIVPTRMNEMMSTGTPEQNKRVTEAFLKMKKFDIKTLEEAFRRE
jgi:predicted 3-demethylubiquinone-9 3-methyltransferase (glyoxalase superfamily)